MRIGEVANAAGVSARSLRYYEANGLVSSSRSPNGWRNFSSETIERVITIQHLFAAGLSSNTIADILPCIDAPPHERTSYLAEALNAQVERLVRERRRIDDELDVLHQLQQNPDAQPTKTT